MERDISIVTIVSIFFKCRASLLGTSCILFLYPYPCKWGFINNYASWYVLAINRFKKILLIHWLLLYFTITVNVSLHVLTYPSHMLSSVQNICILLSYPCPFSKVQNIWHIPAICCTKFRIFYYHIECVFTHVHSQKLKMKASLLFFSFHVLIMYPSCVSYACSKEYLSRCVSYPYQYPFPIYCFC